MTVDEQVVVSALQAIPVTTPPDLVDRVRAGGRHRMLRRRAGVGAGVGVLVAGAVVVPAVLTAGSGHGRPLGPAQQQHVYPGLYAAPPTPGSHCGSSTASQASATAHPELLLLPPAGQAVTDVYLRDEAAVCAAPHVALTALRLDGRSVAAGLVVEGPNAPTAAEVNEAGPGIGHATPPGEEPILGQPATEFRFGSADHIDAYWTQPDGGQWRATVSGLSPADAVALLNQLTLDPKGGTASLPASASKDWTTQRPAADVAPTDTGVLYADWRDPQGHAVSMTVTQGPDRTSQLAAGAPAGSYAAVGYVGPVELVTIRGGRRAVLGTGRDPVLFWQEATDVEVELTVKGASASEIARVADSLTLAPPSDPRICGGR